MVISHAVLAIGLKQRALSPLQNKALQKWIRKSQSKYDFEIDGGIVIEKYPDWKINRKENYSYKNEKDWELLSLK